MTKVKIAQGRFAHFASQLARHPHTVAAWEEAMNDEDRRREVSERIAELRKDRGLTQPQVARMVDVQLRTYQHWEAGGGTSHDNYEALAEVLGSSYDYILTGGDSAPPREDVLGRLDRIEDSLERLLAWAEQVQAQAAEGALEQAEAQKQRPSEGRGT